jgi:4-amino-4-deoxy-L-arabinose transferase-like glycosyltransferase
MTIILVPMVFKAVRYLGPLHTTAFVLLAAAVYASRKAHVRAAKALSVSAVALVLLSVLSVAPRPFADQPFPDAQEAADSARQLVSGNGYVTYVHENKRHPPRYPPGFALALAPFAAAGDDYPWNVQRGATFYAALYVLVAAAAAWSLGGPVAGALAAVLIGFSPFTRAEASLIMSDAFAAGATVLLMLLLLSPTPKRVSAAGLLAGALVATRLPTLVNLVALLVVLPWPMRRRVLLFAAPPLAALCLYNWVTFGGPLRTGYDYWLPEVKNFALAFAHTAPMKGDGPWLVGDLLDGRLLRWVCPCPLGGPQAAMSNLFFYPSVVLGLFWVYLPPLFSVVGMLYGWERRREPVVRFALLVAGFSLLLFTFYYYQGARFMAAPATLLGVLASAKLAGWLGRGAGRAPAA